MEVYAQMAEKIIREQESIIGPIAREQAKKVPGLTIADNKSVEVTGDAKATLDALVGKYADLFGLASVEVCKDAAKEYTAKIPKDQLPAFLQ